METVNIFRQNDNGFSLSRGCGFWVFWFGTSKPKTQQPLLRDKANYGWQGKALCQTFFFNCIPTKQITITTSQTDSVYINIHHFIWQTISSLTHDVFHNVPKKLRQ
jgi:hypothetical protein